MCKDCGGRNEPCCEGNVCDDIYHYCDEDEGICKPCGDECHAQCCPDMSCREGFACDITEDPPECHTCG